METKPARVSFPTLNTAKAKVTAITLPDDTFVGHEFKVFGRDWPAVVNGKWRVPVGEAAVFRYCKFLWWHYWKLIEREGF